MHQFRMMGQRSHKSCATCLCNRENQSCPLDRSQVTSFFLHPISIRLSRASLIVEALASTPVRPISSSTGDSGGASLPHLKTVYVPSHTSVPCLAGHAVCGNRAVLCRVRLHHSEARPSEQAARAARGPCSLLPGADKPTVIEHIVDVLARPPPLIESTATVGFHALRLARRSGDARPRERPPDRQLQSMRASMPRAILSPSPTGSTPIPE